MQRPPPLRAAPKFPITTLIALSAIGVTIAAWNQVNIDALVAEPDNALREPWRLVTTILPHGSLPHLFFNLYWLWAFGTLIEKVFGPARFLGMVVLLAAASSAAEAAVSESGIGLSGVGYGLFGMLWALKRRPGFENVIDKRTIELFVLWFFLCIVTTYLGLMNVANVAHGVGAAVGYLLGICIAAQPAQRTQRVVALAAAIAAVGIGAYLRPPWLSLARGGSIASLVQKGYDALKAKNYQQAADLLGKAVQKDATHADVWYDYGVALEQLNRKSEAFDAFIQAAKLDARPEFRAAVGALGAELVTAEMAEHDPDDVRRILKRAMDVDPNDAKLWLMSGIEKWDSGDKPGAVAAYEKAVELDPSNDEAKKLLDAARANSK